MYVSFVYVCIDVYMDKRINGWDGMGWDEMHETDVAD